MSVIPLRKDQPPPPEPLRKRRVSTMAGIEDHCDGPIEMIAASDGSIELLCRKRTIRIEGKLLVDLFFRREAEVRETEFFAYWSGPEFASEYGPQGWHVRLCIRLPSRFNDQGQELKQYHRISMSMSSALYHGRKLKKVLRGLGSGAV